MRPSIIFVYNGESGMINTLMHAAHKIFSPQTYDCNLCAIVNSHFGMRREWKDFLANLSVDYQFIHTDELAAQYQINNVALPAIFLKKGEQMELRVDAQSINSCQDMNCLQELVLAGIA